MLTYANNVYLFGRGKKIMKLECTNDINSCQFVEQGEYTANKGVEGSVFPVSEELVEKIC